MEANGEASRTLDCLRISATGGMSVLIVLRGIYSSRQGNVPPTNNAGSCPPLLPTEHCLRPVIWGDRYVTSTREAHSCLG